MLRLIHFYRFLEVLWVLRRLLLKDLEQQEVDALHTIHDLRVSIYGTNPFYNIETGEFFPGFDMTDLFEKGN